MATRLDRLEAKIDLLASRLETARDSAILEPLKIEYEFFGTCPELAASPHTNLGFRWHEWEHVWRCNIFNTCHTWYWNESFIIDESTGSMKSWNAIETAVQLSTDTIPIPWDFKGPWYRYQAGGTHAGCGWPGMKDGRDVEIWGVARFFPGTGGYWAWRWFSRA